MGSGYFFPHHITLGYVALWTLAEVIAAQVYPIRTSCKKISLIHCIVAFIVSSTWLVYHFCAEDPGGHRTNLTAFEMPGTFEHHIISLSMAYFVVDMPFAAAFHQTFILHHLLCILAFAAIQGYWKYLPASMGGFDFMAWEMAPRLPKSHVAQYMRSFWIQAKVEESDKQLQLLMGGFNGVFNLWMAELGGVFFHINRALKGTDMELPSRGLFLMMFTLTRCYIWPMYLRQLYSTAAAHDTYYHKVGSVLETGLFLTNIHFLYKNIAPIVKSGRLMPRKPRGYHRRWLDKHPSVKKAASFFMSEERLSLSPSLASLESIDEPEGIEPAMAAQKNKAA